MDDDSKEKFDYMLKVVIVGDSGVGKSNIMTRFTNDKFSDTSKATIGVAFATKSIQVPLTETVTKHVKLQVWDTAGQERYRALSSAYYRGAHGALIVYDITNKQSMDNVKIWLDEIDRFCTQDIAVILVGNKCDLSDKRCVSRDEGTKYADSNNLYFMETSAKDATNIDAAFTLLIKEIIKHQTMEASGVAEKGTITEGGTVDVEGTVDIESSKTANTSTCC
eukprot:TRINITY_DN9680_c0_g1_i1.p1 TRINITY_DN9680_c0_g1~~TRINITY_DN9680_c0_g1_i1.p1  ORF type:complete len:222 (-),score=41.22 TRINITY_DN9680_c0_g1_i1:86-751(-)